MLPVSSWLQEWYFVRKRDSASPTLALNVSHDKPCDCRIRSAGTPADVSQLLTASTVSPLEASQYDVPPVSFGVALYLGAKA